MSPSFGKLYPEVRVLKCFFFVCLNAECLFSICLQGIQRLRNANDYESVVATCGMYAVRHLQRVFFFFVPHFLTHQKQQQKIGIAVGLCQAL